MPPPRPEPRRRNAVETKARIVAAAQELFAARGYAQAGLREIAAHAGVAVSLLPQHFGSKAELFEAALIEAMKSNPVLDGPKAQWGRSMVDYALTDDIRLPAMVVLSAGDADAREITGRVMREHILTELAQRLGGADARERALEITMLTSGFLIYGRQLPVGPVSARTRDLVARLVQAIIDEGAEPAAE